MRLTPRHILLITAVAVVAVAFGVTQAMTAGTPGSIERKGSAITRVLGTSTPGESAQFTVALLEGNDAAHESAHIFQSLESVPGLATATLDTETLALDVSFDPAVVRVSDIRTALVRSGYISMTAADATPAVVAEDGSVQRISVTDDHGFDPSLITAKSGVPLEITFGPGTECRISIFIPALNISQDISQGGVVSLPALDPGTYEIQCSGAAAEASIIVQ